MRRLWRLVQHGFTAGGFIAKLVSLGAGGVAVFIVNTIVHQPSGWQIVLLISVLMLVSGGVLALWGKYAYRSRRETFQRAGFAVGRLTKLLRKSVFEDLARLNQIPPDEFDLEFARNHAGTPKFHNRTLLA